MFIKLCHLGQPAVTSNTPQGNVVTTLSLAYSIGFGDNKQTQWIEAEFWGPRGEKLAPSLTTGRQLLVTANDLRVETFNRNDGTPGAKLKCRVVNIEFANQGPKDE